MYHAFKCTLNAFSELNEYNHNFCILLNSKQLLLILCDFIVWVLIGIASKKN